MTWCMILSWLQVYELWFIASIDFSENSTKTSNQGIGSHKVTMETNGVARADKKEVFAQKQKKIVERVAKIEKDWQSGNNVGAEWENGWDTMEHLQKVVTDGRATLIYHHSLS